MSASSTPSPTVSDDEFNFDEELDRVLEKYRLLAQSEVKYIFESVFCVNNSSYKILTGLSGARGYVPAVRILLTAGELINKTDHVSFNEEEWGDFITYLKDFFKNFLCATADQSKENHEDVQFANYTISRSLFMDIKMLKVTNGSATFYLSENTTREFIHIDSIIISCLDVLHNLDFVRFYNNFLNVSVKIPNVTLDIMLELCNLLPASMQMHCMRECIFYNKNKVLNDLDRKIYMLNV